MTGSAPSDDLEIRAYRPGDETAILALFVECFHVSRSVDRWGWEYDRNPYGNHKISIACGPDGRLAAHHAGYPVRFVQPDGAVIPAFQIGDLMSAPWARGIGRGPTSVLARTVQQFYDHFSRGRVGFHYGFHTASARGFARRFMGSQIVEPVPYRVRPIPGRSLAPGLLDRLLSGIEVVPVERFDERFDQLWQRVHGAYGLAIERDARYLNWRYADCPDREHRAFAVVRRGTLLGWGVFRRKGERLLWGDALFDPTAGGASARLLAHVLASTLSEGATEIAGWFPPRPAWWDRLLRGLDFELRPEPDDLTMTVVPFTFDPVAPLRAELYATMGDGDLF